LRDDAIFTLAVHAGERGPRPDFTPVSTPIYHSTSFLYDEMADLDAIQDNKKAGYIYSRHGSPTVSALERALAALEGGEDAAAFASGMAAIHSTLLATGLGTGDAVVAAQDCYGATYALLARLFTRLGIRVRFVDVSNLDEVRAAVAEVCPKAVFCEVISNPLIKVADVPALADIAHEAGAVFIVDNTFTTPYLFQPLAYGADYVIHSTTKFFGGHGDVLGGAVITSAERMAAMREIIKWTGPNQGPQEAWLVLRGIKTLPLRMRQHCENAAQVAHWLANHPRVIRVNYPGLPTHPQHEVARRLFGSRGFGGMLSFELADAGATEIYRFLEALRLVLPATTLGDVYSLALYPARTSHRALTAEERARIGIGEGLIRLSVGIEAVADIIADLEQALRLT